MKKAAILVLILFIGLQSFAQRKLLIPSKDGLTITGDLYFVSDTLPYMLLCHQAGSSRGEYQESAQRLTKLGFNCLAIDQRSGNEINGVKNETAQQAKSKKKATDYLAAEQDIITALDYLYSVSKKQVVLVGSSYSASLVLKVAANNPKVKGVMAFSPGEYFGDKLKVKEIVKNISVPVFATSSKEESAKVAELMADVKRKQVFVPGTKGDHGSKALWKSTNPNYREYWMAVFMFMRMVK